MFRERNTFYLRWFSPLAKQQLIKLSQASVTSAQLQSAIAAKLVSIPRLGEYFRSGLNEVALLNAKNLLQEDWNQYRQVLDRQQGWKLLLFSPHIQTITIGDVEYSIGFMLAERKRSNLEQLSEPARQQLVKLFQDSIITAQLQSAIAAKLVSIPRFGQYFSTGLNQASFLTVEQLIQKDWNQYQKVLENLRSYEWGRIFSIILGVIYENKLYSLVNLLKTTKTIDFKQLSQNTQAELLALSQASISAAQFQSGIEKRLMFVKPWKKYFTLGLGNFSVLPTQQLKIDNKIYPIAQLFQEMSKDKVTTFFGLSRVAANQYLKLIDARIFVDKVRDMLLAEYWKQLRSMLNKDFTSLPDGANNLSIRNKNINTFDTLFSNRALTFDDLEDSEKTLLRDAILNQENSPSVAEIKRELQRLRGDDIFPITPQVSTKQSSKPPVKNSETSAEDVTNPEKSESEQTVQTNTKQKTKVSKSKTLTITLASVGGTVVLAGVSGFVYWFVKLRK